MLQFFLNPLMLLGIVGVTLPVVAHLLSRRKYDVVHWGAMQFLNPGRRTRRKMKLEELLLLLIRMAAIGLIALAASRPWIGSGFLTGYQSAGSRDIVLVVDGSNSMGRSDGLTSLHQKAVRRAQEFLTTLQPGDTVAVIDARDRPIKVVESPRQDFESVHQHLDQLPPPAGAGDLRRACEDAVGILGRCSNGVREIVVLTDRQRAGWTPDSDASWKRFDDLLKFPSVRPRIWVLDLSSGLGAIRQNISVGQLDVSRDLSVPNFPVSFHVPIRNAGPDEVNVPVQILINGQRVANLDSSVSVPAKSEATFSRSLRFTTVGTNLVTVRVDLPKDSVEADNQSHAAVQITSAVPVLLVESSRSLQKADGNTFFAELALTAPENQSPWIQARTVNAADFSPRDLNDVAVVVLPDVTALADDMPETLHQFAIHGNGVIVSLGQTTTPETFQHLYAETGLLAGVKLDRIRHVDPDAPIPTTIAPYSLEANWLHRFRERQGASFLAAAFDRWWTVQLSDPRTGLASLLEDVDVTIVPVRPEAIPVTLQRPATIARLTSSDPLLLQAKCGLGTVLLMTSNLNTEWNSLPTTPDYVPFLHEAIFQMAASRISRNVAFGQPLQAVLPATIAESAIDQLTYRTPFDRFEEPQWTQQGEDRVATLLRTRVPGVHDLVDLSNDDNPPIDRFVVNYDHAEDDPAELRDNDRVRLSVHDRMTFVDSIDTLRKEMYGNESRSELWAVLLWLFLGILTLEVWMTRRLVRLGHADTNTKDGRVLPQ